jgi:hypothetical protein
LPGCVSQFGRMMKGAGRNGRGVGGGLCISRTGCDG